MESKTIEIKLQRGREHSLNTRHPWIFSGAIASVKGEPELGSTVEIVDADGKWQARGAFSPGSQLRCRVWTWDRNEIIDAEFFRRKVQSAFDYRQRLHLDKYTDSFRLIHGEADGLPGCVADYYNGYVSCEFLSGGVERWRQEIVEAIQSLPGVRSVYERSDAEARVREGLEERCGLLAGEMPPEKLVIHENGLALNVNVIDGHKTGYYLDQRANRRALGEMAADANVLDCCCYSGGFGLQALKNGAEHVTFLDASQESLDMVQNHLNMNSLPADKAESLKADLFLQLRKFRDQSRHFQIIVLDPPKFADTHSRLAGACRGYKDINLLALKLLEPGGRLLTFSCSAAMTPELFAKVVGGAAKDSGRNVRVCGEFNQDGDHPCSLAFPEGHYLKGLSIIVD